MSPKGQEWRNPSAAPNSLISHICPSALLALSLATLRPPFRAPIRVTTRRQPFVTSTIAIAIASRSGPLSLLPWFQAPLVDGASRRSKSHRPWNRPVVVASGEDKRHVHAASRHRRLQRSSPHHHSLTRWSAIPPITSPAAALICTSDKILSTAIRVCAFPFFSLQCRVLYHCLESRSAEMPRLKPSHISKCHHPLPYPANKMLIRPRQPASRTIGSPAL